MVEFDPARQWRTLLAILFALAVVIGSELFAQYQAVAVTERDRLTLQTRVVNENLSQQLTATQHALNSIRSDLPALQALKGGLDELSHRLQTLRDAMPSTRAITVFDAAGNLVARSPHQFIGQNFRQRDYFQVARVGGNPDTLYVAAPFLAATGDYVLNLSKVLLDQRGGFGGVILISLGPEYFSTLLKSVLYAPDMRAALIHADGKVIFRVPDPQKVVGTAVPAGADTFFARHLKGGEPSSVFVGVVAATGEERMSFFQTIRPASVPMDKPLVLVVSRELAALYAPWRTQALTNIGWYLLLLLVTTIGLSLYQRRRRQDALAVRQQETQRQQADQALRDSEARWKFAIEGVGDGLWDWNIQTGAAFYSPRFKAMLGYAEEEFGTTAAEWEQRVHPDDKPRVLGALRPYLKGRAGSVQTEFRMLNKDGLWQWTQGRGMVVSRDAWGRALRMIGTHTDISARKHTESVDFFLAQAGSSPNAEPFMPALARFLAQSLHMEYVCIDRLSGDNLSATTLALWSDGEFQDNVSYALADTPCGAVLEQRVCCYESAVCQQFPKDAALQQLQAESYVGITLRDHAGLPIGLIAVIGRHVLKGCAEAQATLERVAVRAAGELERLNAEERLHLAASVFVHAREGITITDPQGIIIDVNDAFSRITGYSRDDVLGRNPRMLGSGRQDQGFYQAMWRELTEHGHWSGEIWNRRKNGEVFAAMQTISAVRDVFGMVRHYVALFSDITALKAHESELDHMAHFDALTGLPNRLLLADRLQQGIAQVTRRGQRLAVAYLDLDGFKSINDKHGHAVGDQLLIALARHMRQALREGDTMARISGDEFVAVLTDLTDVADSAPLLKRLLAAAAQPLQIGPLSLRVSASLGVTYYPQQQEVEADQLLRQADQAMYQAKVAGKNRYHVFDAELDSSLRGHHESLERIRAGLAAGEFVLHYQPKVNMRTGLVIGVEALVRWQHPDNCLMPPNMFLPVIEDDALAVALGEWVLNTALAQIVLWQAAGLDLPVSVNIGARQLQQSDFVARLRLILAAHPAVNPHSLELEVLETSALQDIDQVSQVIEECAQMGVRFALDDFGTGYSSLTYLKRLRVTLLKIDQSFVRDMLNNPDDLAILQGVIGLAAAFKREVIAEGVETVAHGKLLLQLGCELAQGFGIAPALPASYVLAWVAQWQPDPSWSELIWLGGQDA